MEREKIVGQCLMVGISGTHLDGNTRQHLQRISPGAVILFSRNIIDRRQTKALIEDIKASVDPIPLIAIDQEGGLVVRFFEDITVMPGNMALGAAASPDLAFRQGAVSAQELKSIGIDINLAPVVDVVTGYDNPGITTRSFGGRAGCVAALGKELLLGTQSAGVAAVVKHFPGKGSATKDAHYDLPRVDDSWRELQEHHLMPFEECVAAGVRGVMSTHVLYPHFSPGVDVPATFSPAIIQGYLREGLRFAGVIFSDDMEMGAVARFFPFEEAVVRTARAGHDMILVCSDYNKQQGAFDALVRAGKDGTLNSDAMASSVERIGDLRRWCSRGKSTFDEEISAKARHLAVEIAEKSITVIPGDTPVPLTGPTKIHTIIPDLSTVESRESHLESTEENFIKTTMESVFSEKIQATFLALNATDKEVVRAVRRAHEADLVVAFVFNARYDTSQRMLVERLKALQTQTLFVLVRNPFDLELVAPGPTVVITYGYRRVQLAAAVDVLAGNITAGGILPFDAWFHVSGAPFQDPR
jgi:beta-N-acetylhexosaminidase